jgi:hypothetical protein
MEQMQTDSSRLHKVKGISFLVDEGNEKQAVVIDLKRHRDLWEDFYDTLLTKDREKDPRETLEQVRNRVLGKK